MVKYVIQTWTLKVCNRPSDNFWGLGDIIRGTIKMFQLSKKYNFELIVDTQLHPLSQFLKSTPHQFSDLIKKNKNNIYFIQTPEQYLFTPENKNMDVFAFFTNDKFKDTITEECKDFIKKILTPNNEFLDYILEKISTIPFNSYNVLHYRLGDDGLVKNLKNKNISKYLDHIKKNKNSGDIMVSDSIELKNYIKEKIDIFMFDINISHIGCSTNLKETLLEFFVIINAKKIKTYSVYPWTSGFVTIANEIFDVPLVKLS
jgi:hypothetical protein